MLELSLGAHRAELDQCLEDLPPRGSYAFTRDVDPISPSGPGSWSECDCAGPQLDCFDRVRAQVLALPAIAAVATGFIGCRVAWGAAPSPPPDHEPINGVSIFCAASGGLDENGEVQGAALTYRKQLERCAAQISFGSYTFTWGSGAEPDAQPSACFDAVGKQMAASPAIAEVASRGHVLCRVRFGAPLAD